MNARCFPSAVLLPRPSPCVVRLATPAAAQETSPPAALPAPPATSAAPVWLSSGAEDVLKLSRAKINDDVTVAFVQTSHRRFNLTASEIVYLRKEGVSDRVLTIMLTPQSQATPAPQLPPPDAPAELPWPAPLNTSLRPPRPLTWKLRRLRRFIWARRRLTTRSTIPCLIGTTRGPIGTRLYRWVFIGVGGGVVAITDTGVLPTVTTVIGITTIATMAIIRRPTATAPRRPTELRPLAATLPPAVDRQVKSLRGDSHRA